MTLKTGRSITKPQRTGKTRTVRLKDFDFECSNTSLLADIDTMEDKSSFSPYTTRANRDMIERSFNSINGLNKIPKEERDIRAAYPESTGCAKK